MVLIVRKALDSGPDSGQSWMYYGLPAADLTIGPAVVVEEVLSDVRGIRHFVLCTIIQYSSWVLKANWKTANQDPENITWMLGSVGA